MIQLFFEVDLHHQSFPKHKLIKHGKVDHLLLERALNQAKAKDVITFLNRIAILLHCDKL